MEDAFYLSVDDPDFHRMIRLLQDPGIRKVYHNAPFDIRVLRPWGVDYSNVDDTATMARLLMFPAVLEELSDYIAIPWGLNAPTKHVESMKATIERTGITQMDKMPFEVLAEKCCVDVKGTFAVYNAMKDITDYTYYNVERQLIGILEEVSQKGIKLDQDRREELDAYYSREFNYYKSVGDGIGFNIASGKELGYILSERGAFMKLTPGKTMYATDAVTLKKIRAPAAMPLAQMAILFKHVAKMLNTYIKPMEGQERAYTTMHIDAITGRISPTSAGSNNPDRNLANIPKKVETGNAPPVRSMFVSDGFAIVRGGYVVSTEDDILTRIDQSQVEMRILAYLSGDVRMLAVFNDPNGDIHRETEMAIWATNGPNRVLAKIFNYAMVYGADAATIGDQIGNGDLARVRYLMEEWFKTYPQAAGWRDEAVKFSRQNGFAETIYHRRMAIPIDRGDKHADNCAISYPIQGTAADIFKRVIIELRGSIDWMRLFIHDEIMFQGRFEIPSGIEDISPLRTPMEAEYGARWAGN